MILISSQVILFTLVQILDIQALIVPDEVPSILSIIYSNIPTIKKGTDSRLGYGFRLGDRADIQFLVELGPQTNTQPLANQPDRDGQTKKRSPPDDLIQELYSKQSDKEQVSNTEGSKWLEKWSEAFKFIDGSGGFPLNAKPGLAAGEIDAKSVIPADDQAEIDRRGLVLRQLQEGREGKEEKKIDDENSFLSLLKLMERIQEQVNFEKQVSAISNRKTNEKSKSSNSKRNDNKVETKKDETKKDDIIKQTARRIASTIQNASVAAAAVANVPSKKNEPVALKSSAKANRKQQKQKDDMLMSAAHKIASTVDSASNVVSIVVNPPASMVFKINNETVNDYLDKNADYAEEEKGTVMEKGAQRMAAAVQNASIIASAFPDPPSQNEDLSIPVRNAVDQEDPLITYAEHYTDRRRAVKANADVNNVDSSSIQKPIPQGRNMNLTESSKLDNYDVKGVSNPNKKNEESPTKQTNSSVPHPNEGFLQYLLRRLGYYDYLMSYVPVVPEAIREKAANKPNITQSNYGSSNVQAN